VPARRHDGGRRQRRRGERRGRRPAGRIWQVVPSENPQPHLVTDSEFASVSMGSATDGWAVGSFLRTLGLRTSAG